VVFFRFRVGSGNGGGTWLHRQHISQGIVITVMIAIELQLRQVHCWCMDGDEKRRGSIITPRRRELNRGKKWKKLGMWMWILVVVRPSRPSTYCGTAHQDTHHAPLTFLFLAHSHSTLLTSLSSAVLPAGYNCPDQRDLRQSLTSLIVSPSRQLWLSRFFLLPGRVLRLARDCASSL
jgi:hypothetical protein